jgi:hypothetical protein
MFEGLFVLTTIFVAYVVYTAMGERNTTDKSKAPEAQAAATEQPKPQVAVAKEKSPAVKTVASKSATAKAEATKASKAPKTTKATVEQPAVAKAAAPKTAATKTTAEQPAAVKAVAPKAPKAPKAVTTKQPAAAKKAAAGPTKGEGSGLKNPKTGEIATAYANYRFAKRWIKDALVEEGLLEKVYAGSELNADTDEKIKAAIGKLEALEKYKP